VNLELTEEQELFQETTRKFLGTQMPLSSVRKLYDVPDGFDRAWWRRAAELGWTSLFVPESLDGGSITGRPATDLVVIAEEMGRMLSPGPLLPVNVVAAGLAWSGSAEQCKQLLPGLASGETVAAWAFCEPGGRWDADAVRVTASPEGDHLVLAGAKAYVEAGAAADVLLVTVRTGEGMTQVLVDPGLDGVSIRRGRSIDMTRRFATVTFNRARVPRQEVLGDVGGAADAVERQFQLAIALQCAELVGVAERALEFTIDYGRDRFAFGRPIISYQVLKHRIADWTVRLEGSKAVTDALAAAIDDGDPEAARLARVAKAYVGDTSLDVVDDCVQMTGGMGVTWEHDVHMYNRRAAVDRAVFGTPEEHKDRLFGLLGGGDQA
jgi:alkylation response protein AidB-like acyl-CoA dehydrogenase